MKILLVGNYINNRQQSMQRFAELMCQGLKEAGHEVRLVRPPVVVGRLRRGETGFGKWIGYIDRYLLYPLLLRWQARWADVVHICVDPIYIQWLLDKPHLITCHDVLPIRAALGEIARSKPGWTGRIYQRWSLKNLQKSCMVACVSKQTYLEVQRLTQLPDHKLKIIPNALNYPYRPMPLQEALPRLKYLGLDHSRPFFLHVGGNSWYKNRLGVLRIFAELIRKPRFNSHGLVMAGKPWSSEMRQLAAALGLEDRAVELVNVSNEDLRALYSTATALLFPSFEEGFGWPIIEAQACGCPVITTNRPPMTDVGGEAAIYIDPEDEVGAAETIVMELSEPGRWRSAGFENASRYSRKAMISNYVECYREAIDRYQIESGG